MMTRSLDDGFELLVKHEVLDKELLVVSRASGRMSGGAAAVDGLCWGGVEEGAPHIAWGGCKGEDLDFEKVTGWVTVTDMDGQEGAWIPGVLQAAFWGGRLWLRYSEADANTAESEADELDVGASLAAAGSVADGLVLGCGNGRGPALFVVPMSDRDSWLKRDGKWRADVHWEPLAVYGVHAEGYKYRRLQNDELKRLDEYLVTIWLVPIGRALCFVTSSNKRFHDEQPEQKEQPEQTDTSKLYSKRLAWSEFGRFYSEQYEGPFTPFRAALLPWEAVKPPTDPWLGLVEEADGWSRSQVADGMCCGSLVDGVPTRRVAYQRPVSVCARWHDSTSTGACQATYGGHVEKNETLQQMFMRVFGVSEPGWKELLVHALVKNPLVKAGQRDNAQGYRFHPDAVEGQGVSVGVTDSLALVLPDEYWPVMAEPFRVTLKAELGTVGGSKVYLVLAGSEVDGVLLTSSVHAEELKGVIDSSGEEEEEETGGMEEDSDDLTPGLWNPESNDDDWNTDFPSGPSPNPEEEEEEDGETAVKVGYEKGEGFKSCGLVRREGKLYWKLVLDGAFVEEQLKGVEVEGSCTLKAGGAQEGTPMSDGTARTVIMSLSSGNVSVSGGEVSGNASLGFGTVYAEGASGNSSESLKVTHSLDIEMEVEDKVWYLSPDRESSAGSWVVREASDGASAFNVTAQKWFKWSVNKSSLRTAAANELSKRMRARSVDSSDESTSYDSKVSGVLSGNVLNFTASAVLSDAVSEAE